MATAAKNSMQEDARPLLECPVCVSVFRNPKSLRCGHSVCFDCCEQLRMGPQIACPVCRTRTTVPTEGLPTNFALQDLVEHHATRPEDKKYSCGACDRRQVIDELWTCGTCVSTLICANCAIKEHRGHDLQMVSEIISRRREELTEWRQRMENNVREVDSLHRQTEANVVRIEQRAIQLNATLRTKLVPWFNDTIQEYNIERNVLSKAIQDVDVCDIIGRKPNGQEDTAANSHSHFQNQLNEVPQKLDALKTEQEEILAKQRLALDCVQNCNEVLRQMFATSPKKRTEQPQDNGGTAASRTAILVGSPRSTRPLSPEGSRRRDVVPRGRGGPIFQSPWSNRRTLFGGFNVSDEGIQHRSTPPRFAAIGGIGRGRPLFTAVEDEDASGDVGRTTDHFAWPVLNLDHAEHMAVDGASAGDGADVAATGEQPVQQGQQELPSRSNAARSGSFRRNTTSMRNVEPSLLEMEIGEPSDDEANAGRMREFYRGRSSRRRGGSGRGRAHLVLRPRGRGLINEPVRIPPIGGNRAGGGPPQSDNQSLANATLGSPSRLTANQDHPLQVGSGTSGLQRNGSDDATDGVNVARQIRFIASDSSDDDLTDAILFHTFLPSGNGSNRNTRQSGNRGDS